MAVFMEVDDIVMSDKNLSNIAERMILVTFNAQTSSLWLVDTGQSGRFRVL